MATTIIYMKGKKTLLLLIVGVVFCYSQGISQTAYDTPSLNRAVLKYFSGVELNDMESQDPVKFNRLNYYFAQSFDVVLNDCANCSIDYEVFFNLELFNIVDFENLRQDQSNASFSFKKDKYHITLLSKEQLAADLGVSSVSLLMAYFQFRDFPDWVSTGNNDTDYANYKLKVEDWARDFPEEYRRLTSSQGLLKIPLSDFIVLEEARKEAVYAHPGGYLIID